MAARVGLPLLLPKNLRMLQNLRFVHSPAVPKEPVYPPVVASLTAKSKSARLRQIEVWTQKIGDAAPEEKLRLLARMQRMKFMVYPQTFARDADRWYQHFTKTAYIPGLPAKFGPVEDPDTQPTVDEDTLAEVRAVVTRVILHDQWHVLKTRRAPVQRHQECLVAPLLRNMVAELTYTLSKHNPLLLSSSLDVGPQVGFYWARGRRTIPRGHRSGRPEPIRFQIDDRPVNQIRITEQLPPFNTMEESYSAEVPVVTYCPSLLPLFRRQYDNTNFTGAKLPDPACYGHTQFHLVPDRYHRDRMAQLQQSDQVEVFLRANAIASLFAWTGAQAAYQGFWNHQDVSRPFVSQAVITDGHFFSFFCYQLNTLALSVETDVDNPRKNLLWGTESQRLYEGVKDGQVVGLNDAVIKLLIQFLMNRP